MSIFRMINQPCEVQKLIKEWGLRGDNCAPVDLWHESVLNPCTRTTMRAFSTHACALP